MLLGASAVPVQCRAMHSVTFGDSCSQECHRPEVGVGGKRDATLFSTLDLMSSVFVYSQRLLLSPISTPFDVFDGASEKMVARGSTSLKSERHGHGWISFKRPHDGEFRMKASISTSPAREVDSQDRPISPTAVIFPAVFSLHLPILPPPPNQRSPPLCDNSYPPLVEHSCCSRVQSTSNKKINITLFRPRPPRDGLVATRPRYRTALPPNRTNYRCDYEDSLIVEGTALFGPNSRPI